jgi:succinate dehydrogenase / fumarate reductase, cytochrome b subunit
MNRVAALNRSTVGKKFLMGLSGLVLFGFILSHMAGNLKALQGAEAFNGYAQFLREVGYPALPKYGVLWIARVVLLAAVGVHAVSAFQLWSRSRAARPVRYGKEANLSFSYASRTMRWGGVILLLFVVYHILHFTTGQAHPDFIYGDVYHNFVIGFSNPAVLAIYAVAQVALCLHLFHGLWSAFQTLGANHPKYNHLRRPLATGLALLVFVGFMIPPVAVAIGILS